MGEEIQRKWKLNSTKYTSNIRLLWINFNSKLLGLPCSTDTLVLARAFVASLHICFLHEWLSALVVQWSAWENSSLITFVFSCNLKAITISLGGHKKRKHGTFIWRARGSELINHDHHHQRPSPTATKCLPCGCTRLYLHSPNKQN